LLIYAVCIVGTLVHALQIENSAESKFYLTLAGLSTYLAVESYFYLRHRDNVSLLSPAVLASLAHFLLAYVTGATASIFDPWIIERFTLFVTDLYDEMTSAVLLIWLAAFAMWRGYYFPMAPARRLRRRLERSQVLRPDFKPAVRLLVGLQIVFVAMVMFAISRGIFGISSTSELRLESVGILYFVKIAIDGGALGLFLLFLYYFQKAADTGRNSAPLAIFCYSLLCLHVMVGAISGFKSQIFMPFVYYGVAYFVATRRVPVLAVVAAGVALVISYQVIQPYRTYLYENNVGGRADVGVLMDALEASGRQKDELTNTDQTMGTQIFSRFDLLGMTAAGLSYARAGRITDAERSRFGQSIVLAPVLAYVPRAIWKDKPVFSTGVWFNQNVLGKYDDVSTSVGMGPVTYLYYAGGVVMVFLGFAFFGAFQAILFEGVGRSGFGGLLVYFGVANSLAFIPSDFGPMLGGVLKILPLVVVAQYVLLQARPKARPGGLAPNPVGARPSTIAG